ncbi:transcriptional regulator [Roseibium aggregatum IAM 12614]|jgi:DNA-binding transcriptional MerR regulator|uniref:Transcriptional regulator n=2 Tax=Stappiaceae TaxID=2821832 RepID=A0NRA5_ROSAI|nr:transcriptional regulator [Roseibium aggregatum IAM 12614]
MSRATAEKREQTAMSEALSILNEDDLVDVVSATDDSTKKTQFTIGDLAKEFDCTLRTLRFYEDKGLLNPKRDGLNRVYNRRDRARLKLVLMGKRVGFSLSEIRDMLDLYDLRDGQVTQLRVALSKFNEQIAVLEEQRKDIEQAIEELSRTVEIVSGMLKHKEAEEA